MTNIANTTNITMTMENKVSIRTDVISRQPFAKDELLRLVKIDGYLYPDLDQNRLGRGIYLIKDKEKIKKFLESKSNRFGLISQELEEYLEK